MQDARHLGMTQNLLHFRFVLSQLRHQRRDAQPPPAQDQQQSFQLKEKARGQNNKRKRLDKTHLALAGGDSLVVLTNNIG